MDEAAVKDWLTNELGVSRETLEKLDRLVALLIEENARQNLVARSTIDTIWERHIADSAQLLTLAPPDVRVGKWIDLGSGPGLPGLVLAVISGMDIALVEMRAKRVDFLKHAVDALDLLDRVEVEGTKVERITTRSCDIVTARAFAPLDKLFAVSLRFAHENTRWLLPKGKSAQEELEAVRRTWQGDFALHASLTSPEAFIIEAHNVRPRRHS